MALPFSFKELHEDLEKNNHAGIYGHSQAPYWGIAEAVYNADMGTHHSKRSEAEFMIDDLAKHVKNPRVQERWKNIAVMDPQGMTASKPTIAATTAHMNIPELEGKLIPDGKVVNEDGSINIVKAAVDYVWNLPMLSKKLGISEKQLRESLHKWSNNPDLLDESKRAYLPPCSGVTVYFFGDILKLGDENTEHAVRVHDECNGSDVFGTDICTCRPYLMFAIKSIVELAQRGGVGVVAYFRKEGRSLGEVTKFRVYNARKNQKGGDRAETYFYQTECIAGVRDARFQVMMPDVLSWIGIKRIDWLHSMSSEKYDAICGAGIQVMQRVSLPDACVPQNALVEINAKIASGYHTDELVGENIDSELRKLPAIRRQCNKVFELAKQDKTVHFKMDLGKLPVAVGATLDSIHDQYPDLNIPYHSRFRHFDARHIEDLMESWPCDKSEKVRRLVDLATISVLLDAGAGSKWQYIGADNVARRRSEGLAVASLVMFEDGKFSSDSAVPCRVNSVALKNLTLHELHVAFQVSQNNPIVGLEGRLGILQRLGESLEEHPVFFGEEVCRPGNIVDFLRRHAKPDGTVSMLTLWDAVINGLVKVWPTTLSGVRRGDVWVYNPLKVVGVPGSDMIPFHKLSQWLILSIMEPLEMLEFKFTDVDQLTALAEYRNGGLLVDTGVLVPRDPTITKNREFDVGSEIVVEWRALTLVLIDKVAEEVRKRLGKTAEELQLSKVLEGGTWRAGRIAARKARPENGLSPILIRSDGTVF